MNENIDNRKIDKNLFTFLSTEEKIADTVVRPSVSYWQDAWRKLRSNKTALVSMIIIIVLIISAIIVPMLSHFSYSAQDLPGQNIGPNSNNWFGTDQLGRDLFVRTFYGARYSIFIAFVSAIISIIVGVLYGSIAGFSGGKIDNFMMRVVDIIYSFPTIMIVILLMTIFNSKPGQTSNQLYTIIIAISITYWMNMARIVRGEVLQLKQQEFVLAARALGANNSRILFKHLLPNSLGSIIVTTTLLVPQAVFLESFLSYIGIGLSAPKASLGTLASDGQGVLFLYPYQLFFPALMICLIILSFNLFGDGLRDALDPKMNV